MDTKPWWASKTLWSNAVMIGAALVGAFSLNVGLDLSLDGQAAIVGVVMGVVNILLRMVTTTAITTA